MNLNFDWYRTFYYVAEFGSVSQAAEKLFISQPAVSQVIKQLERSLDCSLFVRTSKGVQLTADGEMLYYYVKPGVEQIKLGEKKIRELKELSIGELHIGASDMTLKFYLLPYLETFHRLYPAIKISVTNGPTPETVDLLRQGKIDFGVVTEPLDSLKGFTAEPVSKVHDVFICSSSLKELKDKAHSPKDLVPLPLICLEKNTSSRRHLDEFFASHGLTLQPEFELATSDLIVEFVKKGLGVGCVMRDFALDSLKRGDVYELQLSEPIPHRNMRILVNDHAPISNAAKVLLDMLYADADI